MFYSREKGAVAEWQTSGRPAAVSNIECFSFLLMCLARLYSYYCFWRQLDKNVINAKMTGYNIHMSRKNLYI